MPPAPRRAQRVLLARAGVAVATALALSGCVSARDVASNSAGAIASPTTNPQVQCPLLTSTQLDRITGTQFHPDALVGPDSSQSMTQCQWSAADGLGLVTTTVTTTEPAFAYRQALQLAQRSLGVTQKVSLPRVDAAFVVATAGRTYMLADGKLVEVNVVLPEVTPEQNGRIIEAVARGTDKL